MRFPVLLASFALSCLAACSPKPAPDAAPAPTKSEMVAIAPPAPELDIGDVEYDIALEATVPEDARTPGIEVEEVRTYIKELSNVTVAVDASQHPTLPLHFRVRHTRNYERNAVSVSLRVLRDGEVIANHGGIVAGLTYQEPLELTVNAFQGLESLPETMLVHGEMDMQLLDASGTALGEHSTELSNPVRINITGAKAAAAQEQAPESAAANDGNTDALDTADSAQPASDPE